MNVPVFENSELFLLIIYLEKDSLRLIFDYFDLSHKTPIIKCNS